MSFIEDLNGEYARHLWVTTLFCMLILMIGLFGNGSVLFIYNFKLNAKGESRYFIPHLAIADAFSILFSCIAFTYGNFNMFYFPWNFLCKGTVFACIVPVLASMFLLFAIAVQRHTKMSPSGRQFTLNWRRATIGIIWTLSVCFSAPFLSIAGVGKINGVYNEVNLTSVKCHISNSDYPTFETVYFGVLASVLVLNIATTIGLYISIAFTVKKYKRQTFETSTNFNVMFFAVVVVYVLSFVPTGVMALFINQSDLPSNGDLPVWKLQVYGLLTRFFIFNNVVNPFIYAYFDVEFRKYLKRLLPCNRRRDASRL